MISNELFKQKILDCAIHGELVENEKDIDSIDIEEIKEDVPFDIPDNWKWVTLDKIGKVISGTSYDKSKISDSGIRIIRGGNISNNKLFLCGDDVFLPNEYYSEEKQLQLGDIVLVASTGSMDAIGKPAIVNDMIENTQIGAFLRIVRVRKEYSKYLGLIFMSDYYRNQIRDLVKGMAINNIKNGYLLNMLIPLPPLEEQIKITSKVYELFDLIERKEKNDKEKDKLKKVLKEKILNGAFDGNLTSSNTENWNKYVFSDIIDVRDGTHDSPKYVEYSDYPLITSKNLTEKGLDFSNVNYLTEKDYNEINKRSFVDDGDVLFAMIGSIGNPVIVKKERPFAIKNVALFKCGNNILNKFLYYYLLHEKDMSEQTKGGVQKFVSLKILRNYPICLPPLEEQKIIVEKIESLFELIEQL